MEGDDKMLKDPLEKVSGTVRKAVNLNRTEVGGLRNTVTQISRERLRSVSKLSKQQEAFMKKQSKLLPALRLVTQANSLQKSRRNISRSLNEVIPLYDQLNDSRNCPNSEAMPRIHPKTEPLPRKKTANTYTVLPPIKATRKQSESEKEIHDVQNVKKQRRMSEYQKQYSSLQLNISNAHKFSQQRLGSPPAVDASANQSNNDFKRDFTHNHINEHDMVFPNLDEHDEISDEIYNKNQTQTLQVNSHNMSKTDGQCLKFENGHQRKFSSVNAQNVKSRVQDLDPDFEREMREAVDQVAAENSVITTGDGASTAEQNASGMQPKRDAKSHWSLIRNRMRYLLLMEQRRENKYLGMLFQEIQSCRYIRKHPNQEKPDKDNESDIWN